MKTVAIVVGHLPESPGACNSELSVSEFDFNNKMAPIVAKEVRLLGYRPLIVYRETYPKLPQQVNETKADIFISLHCNAFDLNPHGSEVLYYHASKKGKALATAIQKNVVNTLGFADRGVKPVDYDHVGKAGDRGGWLLEKTVMPGVTVEPFFIDANKSLIEAQSKIEELARAIAGGVADYFEVG